MAGDALHRLPPRVPTWRVAGGTPSGGAPGRGRPGGAGRDPTVRGPHGSRAPRGPARRTASLRSWPARSSGGWRRARSATGARRPGVAWAPPAAGGPTGGPPTPFEPYGPPSAAGASTNAIFIAGTSAAVWSL